MHVPCASISNTLVIVITADKGEMVTFNTSPHARAVVTIYYIAMYMMHTATVYALLTHKKVILASYIQYVCMFTGVRCSYTHSTCHLLLFSIPCNHEVLESLQSPNPSLHLQFQPFASLFLTDVSKGLLQSCVWHPDLPLCCPA